MWGKGRYEDNFKWSFFFVKHNPWCIDILLFLESSGALYVQPLPMNDKKHIHTGNEF